MQKRAVVAYAARKSVAASTMLIKESCSPMSKPSIRALSVLFENLGSELGDKAKSSQRATHHRSSDHTACCTVPLNNANNSHRELAGIDAAKLGRCLVIISFWKGFGSLVKYRDTKPLAIACCGTANRSSNTDTTKTYSDEEHTRSHLRPRVSSKLPRTRNQACTRPRERS